MASIAKLTAKLDDAGFNPTITDEYGIIEVVFEDTVFPTWVGNRIIEIAKDSGFEHLGGLKFKDPDFKKFIPPPVKTTKRRVKQ